MAPIALLLVFLRYYIAYSWGAFKLIDEDDEQQTDEDDQQEDQQDDQDDEKAKVMCTMYIIMHIIAKKIIKYDNYNAKHLQEEKKSLKERVAAVQEVTQLVQNTIGDIASFGEKIKK